MTIPSIPCPSCGFTLKPVWFLEKELDNHGIPTGLTRKACSCLLCEACDALNLYDIDYDLDDGDRIMVDDSFYDDVLDAFEEYDIEYEEV